MRRGTLELELNFYFPDRNQTDVLYQVIRTLISLGAHFAGTAGVQRGENIRDAPFCSAMTALNESAPSRIWMSFNTILLIHMCAFVL